jgi:FixJ family two-component response regulator
MSDPDPVVFVVDDDSSIRDPLTRFIRLVELGVETFAAELGTSEITVKLHRSQVMHKMRAVSLAELVRMAAILELPATK